MLKARAKNFCGVYSDDELPKVVHLFEKDNFTLVANLSKTSEPGSHFVVIAKTYLETVYMDSFGMKPLRQCEGIMEFLRNSPVPVIYNDRQIQDWDSHFCGFFSILFCFIYDDDPDTPIRERLHPAFNTVDLKENDVLVLKHIRNFLRKDTFSMLTEI